MGGISDVYGEISIEVGGYTLRSALYHDGRSRNGDPGRILDDTFDDIRVCISTPQEHKKRRQCVYERFFHT